MRATGSGRWEPAVVLALLALGTWIAFWRVGEVNIGPDELVYQQAGLAYVKGDLSLNPEHPPLAKLALGVWQLVFGEGVVQARWLMGVVLLLTAALCYLWTRAAFGWPQAAAASALLLTMHRVGGDGFIDRAVGLDPFAVMFGLAGLWTAWEWGRRITRPGSRSVAAAGITAPVGGADVRGPLAADGRNDRSRWLSAHATSTTAVAARSGGSEAYTHVQTAAAGTGSETDAGNTPDASAGAEARTDSNTDADTGTEPDAGAEAVAGTPGTAESEPETGTGIDKGTGSTALTLTALAVLAGAMLACAVLSKAVAATFLIGAVAAVPWHRWRSIPVLTGIAAFVGASLTVCLLVYLPFGLPDAMLAMLDFQLQHANDGHTIVVAGTEYQRAPWFAMMWFAMQVVGPWPVAGLAAGTVLAGLLHWRERAFWMIVLAAGSAFIALSASPVVLPHYTFDWLWGASITAGIGLVSLWRHSSGAVLRSRRAAGEEFTAQHMVAAVVAAALAIGVLGGVAHIAGTTQRGVGRVDAVLAAHPAPDGSVLIAQLSPLVAEPNIELPVTCDLADPTITAVAVGSDTRVQFAAPQELLDYLQRSAELVELDDVELFILTEPLPAPEAWSTPPGVCPAPAD